MRLPAWARFSALLLCLSVVVLAPPGLGRSTGGTALPHLWGHDPAARGGSAASLDLRLPSESSQLLIPSGRTSTGGIPSSGQESPRLQGDPTGGHGSARFAARSLAELGPPGGLSTNVTVGIQPGFSAYDIADGYVYVPDNGSDTVSVLWRTTVQATIAVGHEPTSATYDPQNGGVYVTNSGSSNVSVIVGTRVVGTVAVGGGPGYAALDPVSGEIYVTNALSNNVSVIYDTSLAGTVAVGSVPGSPIYDAQDGEVYVEDLNETNLTVINGTTNVGKVNLLDILGPPAYDFADGDLYVPVGNQSVAVVRGMTRIANLTVGTLPWMAAYDDRTGTVYVPNLASGNVSIIRATTIVASPAVGSFPLWALYDPVTDRVYVSDGLDPNVSVLQGRSVVATIPSVANGLPTAYDAHLGTVYVSESLNNTVQVIRPLGPYRVTFNESGLAARTIWGVILDGTPGATNGTSLVFTSWWNGSFPYSVLPVPGYSMIPNGNATVTGSDATVDLVFSPTPPATYQVLFLPLGLSGSTSWSVNLSGEVGHSAGGSIAFQVPNGSYGFTVAAIPGFAPTPSSGTVPVLGGNTTLSITFTSNSTRTFRYVVTFSESGLTVGVPWSVTFIQSQLSGSGNLSFGPVSNGTYPFTIGTIAGYTADPTSGQVNVSGAPVDRVIDFTATDHGHPVLRPPTNGSTPVTFLGLPASEGYALVAVLVLIAVVVGVALALRGRARPPAEPVGGSDEDETSYGESPEEPG